MLSDEVRHRFEFHPATESTGPLHDAARQAAIEFATWIVDNTPAGRHQSLALTAAQEALQWANAAIACDGTAPKARPTAKQVVAKMAVDPNLNGLR